VTADELRLMLALELGRDANAIDAVRIARDCPLERHFQPFARLSQLSAFVPPRLRFLVEHPERVRSREFPFGNATVFDAEVTVDACTAAVMLDVDPIGMVLCGQPLPWRRSVPARVRASRLSDRHCKSVEHYPDFGSTALAFAKQAERNTAPRPLRKRPTPTSGITAMERRKPT
jgi:RNA repair, ligase-Pnkp-associating, region of Hen1